MLIFLKFYQANEEKADNFDEIYDCELCDHVYDDVEWLNAHKKHDHDPHPCPECPENCIGERNLKVHLLFHRLQQAKKRDRASKKKE